MLMTNQEAKASVSRLRRVLKALDTPTTELNHSAVCEIFAQALGCKNWGDLKARLAPDGAASLETVASGGSDPGIGPVVGKVWLATWDHPYGEIRRIFTTSAVGEGWKFKIADDHWDSELPGHPRPADAESLAEQYFQLLGEAGVGEGEFFKLEEMVVESAVSSMREGVIEQIMEDARERARDQGCEITGPNVAMGWAQLSAEVLGLDPTQEELMTAAERLSDAADRDHEG